MANIADKEIMTTGEAAKFLGCSIPCVIAMVEQGIFKAWPVGRRGDLRIHRSEVEAYRDGPTNTAHCEQPAQDLSG